MSTTTSQMLRQAFWIFVFLIGFLTWILRDDFITSTGDYRAYRGYPRKWWDIHGSSSPRKLWVGWSHRWRSNLRRKLGALEVSSIDFKDRWIRPYRRLGKRDKLWTSMCSWLNRSFWRVVNPAEMIGKGIGLEMKGFCESFQLSET